MKIIKSETLHVDQDGQILAEKITYQRADGSVGVKTLNKAPTKTQQHYKDQANINNILAKWHKSGIDPRRTGRKSMYVDHRDLPKDYETALQKVMAAEDTFDHLPSSIRNKFNNNVQAMIDFAKDPKNLEEGIKIGLFEPPKPPPRDLVKEIAEEINKPKPDKA